MTRERQTTTGRNPPASPPGVRLVRVLIVLIGAHSCILGLLMLFAPAFMLRLAGFTQPAPLFFPAQSGIFLLIIGICYLLALTRSSFELVIPLSKSLAVLFLTAYGLFLSLPPLIWAANAGDALMLAAFAGALFWRRQGSRAGRAGDKPCCLNFNK